MHLKCRCKKSQLFQQGLAKVVVHLIPQVDTITEQFSKRHSSQTCTKSLNLTGFRILEFSKNKGIKVLAAINDTNGCRKFEKNKNKQNKISDTGESKRMYLI